MLMGRLASNRKRPVNQDLFVRNLKYDLKTVMNSLEFTSEKKRLNDS